MQGWLCLEVRIVANYVTNLKAALIIASTSLPNALSSFGFLPPAKIRITSQSRRYNNCLCQQNITDFEQITANFLEFTAKMWIVTRPGCGSLESIPTDQGLLRWWTWLCLEETMVCLLDGRTRGAKTKSDNQGTEIWCFQKDLKGMRGKPFQNYF